MIIELATEQNIDNWMDLVNKVKDCFPGFEPEDSLDNHRKTVLEFMEKGCAIWAKICNKIVGALLFSKETNTICFLTVDTEYRRQHIAKKMFSYMLTFINPNKDITVATYRADVPEGIPARMFYKRMGFVEGKLTEEFGSPVQKFILKR